MNILIIDNREAFLRIHRYAVLRGFPDATVRFAANGTEALELLGTWTAQIILSEYHLPGMDGFQLLLQIRRKFKEVPVGFVSAENGADILKRTRAAGAAFFITIPFKDDQLVAAIRQVLLSGTVASPTPERGLS